MVFAMNKILILGGSSYVGKRLFERLGPERSIATYNNTPLSGAVKFNSLTMRVDDLVDDLTPFSHAIILLGDTNPETCFADPEVSQALNVDSIKRVIDDLLAHHIKPIFTSSEFVFDGQKGDYTEQDVAEPILLYGQQKLDVEHYLQSVCPEACILRLAKVFGGDLNDGTLFSSWLPAIQSGQTIRCATDQIFSPVYREDVVEALIRAADQDISGLYHLSGPLGLSRLDCLNILIEHLKPYQMVQNNIESCSILDFDLKEKRPLNVSMIPKKLEQAIGYDMTDPNVVCQQLAKSAFSS